MDFCDAQSARSDSCVSEEEFDEVYHFAKLKKKTRENLPRKIKDKANNSLCHKSNISDIPHNKPKTPFLKIK